MIVLFYGLKAWQDLSMVHDKEEATIDEQTILVPVA